MDKILKKKYKLSESIFLKKFENEDYRFFLSYFDLFNIYSLFPTIKSYDINNEKLSINDIKNKLTENQINLEDFNKISKNMKSTLKDKVTEMIQKVNLMTNLSADDKIRYFFSYEVIDYVAINYNAQYVTTAWLKCYEILEYYDMFNIKEFNKNSINYFGICEQPGAFIFGINHYVKTKCSEKVPDVKFNFIVQSLKPTTKDKKIFPAHKELFNNYRDNYDYGHDKSGDITNLDNIKYYRKKYYDKHFDIISADCGLDCSSDFSTQEDNLVIVILGQLLNALGLADKGTNYFFKLFSIYEKLTCELIYLVSLFFENVYLCRVLKTKITSGEIYCVCKNFKFNKDEMDSILEKLYDKFEQCKIMDDKKFTLIKITEDYLQNIMNINNIFYYSRMLSINFMYFRYNNIDYVKNNKEIKKYINELVEHYVKYFCAQNKLKLIDNKDNLVNTIIQNNWINKN